MRSPVRAHVDHLSRGQDTTVGSFLARFGITYKGDHCTMSILAHIYVEDFDPWYGLDALSYVIDSEFVPTFAKIGYTFYEFVL